MPRKSLTAETLRKDSDIQKLLSACHERFRKRTKRSDKSVSSRDAAGLTMDDVANLSRLYVERLPLEREFSGLRSHVSSLTMAAKELRKAGRLLEDLASIRVPIRPRKQMEEHHLFAEAPRLAEELRRVAWSADFWADRLKHGKRGQPPKEVEREFRREFWLLARWRTGYPCDELGAALFRRIFGVNVTPTNYRRMRQADSKERRDQGAGDGPMPSIPNLV